MNIVDLRTCVVWTNHQRSWLFLEVETDDGLIGIGEASQSRNDAAVIEEVRRLKPQYIGENPLDLIERRQSLLDWPYTGRSMFAAVSGIEQALWDLCGKRLNVPVYQLLGGRVLPRVRAYANVGYAAVTRDPEPIVAAALSAVQEGYDAIKCYPFGIRHSGEMGGADEHRWIDHGIEIVRSVREAVGDRVEILVDLMHQFQELKQVRDILRRLDAYNLFWVEDPFMHDDPLQLAELRRAIRPRLAGGAPLLSRHQWRPLLEGGALDVIMPDVKWMGGISQVKKLAAMAEVFGVMVSPHNASGPVATAANVHLSLSLANFAILEYPWGVPSWRSALTRGTERIDSGHFEPPTAPGLGIDLDAVIAAEHMVPPPATVGAGIQLPLH